MMNDTRVVIVNNRHRLIWVAAGVVCLIFLFFQFNKGFAVFTDDPFISFRYARNLAHGRGLVFNDGERVEGYSNFLWVIMLAGGITAGVDPIIFSKILGVIFNSGTLLTVVFLSYRLFGPSLYMLVPPLLLGLNIDFIRWGGGGLETPMFTFWVTGALCWFFARRTFSVSTGQSKGTHRQFAAPAIGSSSGSISDSGKSPNAQTEKSPDLGLLIFSSICIALACLSRPEGCLIGMMIAMCAGVFIPERKTRFRIIRFLLTGLLAAAIPLTLWRLAYYGDILPNTFYCKVSVGRVVWSHGIGYVIDFFRCGGGLILVTGLIASLISRSRISRGLNLVLLFYSTMIILMGGDWMPFHRFMLPVLPIILILMAIGYRYMLRNLNAWFQSGSMIAVVCLITIWPVIPKSSIISNRLLALEYSIAGKKPVEDPGRTRLSAECARTEDWIDSKRCLGEWLRRNAPPDATLAIGAAGAIPYFSDLRTIDFFGKITREIAMSDSTSGWSMSGHQKYDQAIILGEKPDFIIFSGSGKESGEPVFWLKRFGLYTNDFFRNNYRYQTIEIEGYRFGFYNLKKTEEPSLSTKDRPV